MRSHANLVVLGKTASAFLAFIYTVCFAFDAAFPQSAMFGAWQKLLPGFDGISWTSYFIGLAETYGYGWLFAAVWAPLYNFFAARSPREWEAT